MGLNINLVSQFAKLTANKKETKKESTAWGEVIEITNGKCFVKLDGSDLVTPVTTITEAKVGDRVSVTIKNHSATLTGNASSPSINADGSTVGAIRTDFNNLSADNLVIREKLRASEGDIAKLTAKNVKVEETLEAHAGKFDTLESDFADFEVLSSKYAAFDHINAIEAEFRSAIVTFATIESLEAERAKIDALNASKADITDLTAVQARINLLDADVGKIDTLVANFISGSTVNTQFVNSVIAMIGSAQIKDAMIDTLSADKITAGEIITDKVKIKSEDGSLIISGPVLQIGDGTQTRIQIGKDASGAYSFAIFNAAGEPIFYEDGITENGIPDSIIVNDMIKDDANISASKLDINTLFSVINNDGSHTLKSSKVKLNEEGQTLDVAFSSLTTKVDGIQIGGINLLKKTRAFDGVSGASSIVEDTYRDLKVRYLDCTDMPSGYPLFRDMVQWAEAIPAEGGAQYTLSFYAKGTNIRAHFFNGAFGVVRAESSQGIVKTSAVNDGNMDFTLTDEWKRYWVTYTVEDTNTQDNTGKKYVLLRVLGLEEAYACGVKFEKGNKATDWSPAPEDAETEISSLNSQYHNLNVTIGDLRSTIGEQSQEIATKADGTTVATLSDQYSDLNQTVNGLSSTVGSHTTQFNQLSDDFNNLSIGGRNLLINTGNTTGTIKMRNSSSTQTNGVSGFTNNNGVRTWNCHVDAVPVGTSNPPEIYYRFMPTTSDGLRDLEVGETYIFSGKVKLSTTSGTLTRLAVRTQGFVSPSWTGGINNNILTEDSDEWVEFSEKFTVQDNATNYYVSLQLYYEVGTEYSGVIQIKEFKIEKGNKKTEWSPAPEDAETRIISAETKISQNTESITLRATKSELVNGIAEAKSYADSQIKVSSDAITLSVTNISRSGRNLVKGSSQKDTALGGYPSSGNYEGVGGDTTIITNENQYVLSFEAKSTVAGDKIHCFFYNSGTVTKAEWFSSDSPTTVKGTSGMGDGNTTIQLTTSWARYWIKYTQNGSSVTAIKKWIVGRRLAGEGSGTVSVRSIKMEAGHNPTPWSPAPEDARSSFANDSSNVTITNGTIAFKTGTLTIDAGNFTLDSTGNIIAISGSIAGWVFNKWGLFKTVTHDTDSQIAAGSEFSMNFYTYDYYYHNDDPSTGRAADAIVFRKKTADGTVSYPFVVRKDGFLHATNAVIEGVITTTSGATITRMTSGGLAFYRDDTIYGTITSKYYDNAASNGLAITVRQSGSSGLMFVSASGDDLWTTNYEIQYVLQPAYMDVEYCYDYGGSELGCQHTFYNNVRFYGLTQHVQPSYFHQALYMGKNATIGWMTSNGQPYQLLRFASTSEEFQVGLYNSFTTTVQGHTVNIAGFSGLYLKNYSETLRLQGLSSIGTYSGYFYSTNNGLCCLGTSSYRWYKVYSKYADDISSDRRLKENIVGLSDTHSELFDKLQPVQYNFIDGDGRIHYGLIAQDVVAAMEEMGMQENDLDLVNHEFNVNEETGELNDTYGMAYTNLIPMLIHEVQKLKKEIKTLKGE